MCIFQSRAAHWTCEREGKNNRKKLGVVCGQVDPFHFISSCDIFILPLFCRVQRLVPARSSPPAVACLLMSTGPETPSLLLTARAITLAKSTTRSPRTTTTGRRTSSLLCILYPSPATRCCMSRRQPQRLLAIRRQNLSQTSGARVAWATGNERTEKIRL